MNGKLIGFIFLTVLSIGLLIFTLVGSNAIYPCPETTPDCITERESNSLLVFQIGSGVLVFVCAMAAIATSVSKDQITNFKKSIGNKFNRSSRRLGDSARSMGNRFRTSFTNRWNRHRKPSNDSSQACEMPRSNEPEDDHEEDEDEQ